MSALQLVPIFLAVESTLILVLVITSLRRRGQTAAWFTPALAFLAGTGLVIFLFYAFVAT